MIGLLWIDRQNVCPIGFQVLSLWMGHPFTNTLYGLSTKWICEINQINEFRKSSIWHARLVWPRLCYLQHNTFTRLCVLTINSSDWNFTEAGFVFLLTQFMTEYDFMAASHHLFSKSLHRSPGNSVLIFRHSSKMCRWVAVTGCYRPLQARLS